MKICDELAAELLRAIERRDLDAMERNVQALRSLLTPLPGGADLRAERLDALSGLAEEIERSIRRMRATAAAEMARILAAAPLLEHVALGAPRPLSLH